MGVNGMLMYILLDKMQDGPVDDGQSSLLGQNDVCVLAVQMKAAAVYRYQGIIADAQVAVEKQAATGNQHLPASDHNQRTRVIKFFIRTDCQDLVIPHHQHPAGVGLNCFGAQPAGCRYQEKQCQARDNGFERHAFHVFLQRGSLDYGPGKTTLGTGT